ncbi:MAG: hypothetical protein AB8B73_04840 [Ekhidna sp.]
MRFPSLFRLSKHQQFVVKPRYYDPVKEEIREREEIARRRMENGIDADDIATKISFKRKATKAPATSMIQLVIAVLLGALVYGWIELGNDIFYYALWIIVPAYLLYRFKSFTKRK